MKRVAVLMLVFALFAAPLASVSYASGAPEQIPKIEKSFDLFDFQKVEFAINAEALVQVSLLDQIYPETVLSEYRGNDIVNVCEAEKVTHLIYPSKPDRLWPGRHSISSERSVVKKGKEVTRPPALVSRE